MNGKPNFSIIKVGDELPSKSLSVTQEMINEYAHICGDYNQLHVDLEVAEKSIFKGTIAHGTINVEPIFQAIGSFQGTYWPVEGTKIDIQFRAPVRPGDTISSKMVVTDKKTEGGKHILVCDIFVSNDKGTDCIKGTGEIVIPG